MDSQHVWSGIKRISPFQDSVVRFMGSFSVQFGLSSLQGGSKHTPICLTATQKPSTLYPKSLILYLHPIEHSPNPS